MLETMSNLELLLRSALDEYETELREAGKAPDTVTTYVDRAERFVRWLCR